MLWRHRRPDKLTGRVNSVFSLIASANTQHTILVMITFQTLLATPAYLSIEKDVDGLRAR